MWINSKMTFAYLTGLLLLLTGALDESQIELKPTYNVITSNLQPGDSVAAPVVAHVPSGPTADTLTFVLNPETQSVPAFPDPTPNPIGTWEGPLSSVAFAAHNQHYVGRLEIPAAMLAQSTATSFAIYALSNATASAVVAADIYNTTLDFDGRSQLSPISQLRLAEDDTVDADDNGIPEDPDTTIPAHTTYVTSSAFLAGVDAGQVLFANLDNSTGVPNVFTLDGIVIQAPTRAALQSAGAIAPGENAFLLVKRVDTLADMPDLFPNFANGAAFAADVAAEATTVGPQISEEYLITLMAGASGSDLQEVGNIASTPILVRINANITDPTLVEIQGFDIAVVDQAGTINVVELGTVSSAWSQVDGAPIVDQANGLVDGFLSSGAGSLIAVFEVTDDPPTALCQNIDVQLDINGTVTILAADIDNGSTDDNGGVTLSVTPDTFTCAELGVNNVTLTVTDSASQTTTCNATVTVSDQLNVCNPDLPPTAVCQNITVQLDNTGNVTILGSDVDNGSTDDIGIASLSVLPNSFTCAELGANIVTLTVTDSIAQTTTCNATVTVTDPLGGCSPPIADFTASATNLNATFTNTSQIFAATTIDYDWDFGDGGSSTAPNPTHTYAAEGTYAVTLTVTTDLGTDDFTQNLTVGLAPIADFTFTEANLLANFTDASQTFSATNIGYAWTFGDGGSSTAQNPAHTYAADGTYSVTLTVTTEFGADPVTKFVTATAIRGACCFPDAACFEITPVNCANAGGTYQGDNTLCSGVTCTNIIPTTYHTADQTTDHNISLTELLRLIQFFNLIDFQCDAGGEDGFNPGIGDQTCSPHNSDYNTQNWQINLAELLRLIQIFNLGGYFNCPGLSEDNYCPVQVN